MALLQHLALLAASCLSVDHVPSAESRHVPRSDVAFGQSLVLSDSRLSVPLVIDVLRDRQAGPRPLLGETSLGTLLITGNEVVLQRPGQPDHDLSADCAPPPAAKRQRR